MWRDLLICFGRCNSSLKTQYAFKNKICLLISDQHLEKEGSQSQQCISWEGNFLLSYFAAGTTIGKLRLFEAAATAEAKLSLAARRGERLECPIVALPLNSDAPVLQRCRFDLNICMWQMWSGLPLHMSFQHALTKKCNFPGKYTGRLQGITYVRSTLERYSCWFVTRHPRKKHILIVNASKLTSLNGWQWRRLRTNDRSWLLRCWQT